MTALPLIVQWLLLYKYAILLPLAILEGPIITVLGGFFAAQGYLNIVIVYVIVIIGDLVGDGIYYAVGRFGGRKLITKYGHYINVTSVQVERIERHFARHTRKTLVFAKLTHALGIVVLIAAGIARVPFGEFLFFNFLPTLPKSLVLILAGYFFGHAYVVIDQYINYGSLLLGVFGLLLALIYMIFRKRHKNVFQE